MTVPKLYPQEVYVHSLSSSSVRVTWRGISTSREEETLEGYMVRICQLSPVNGPLTTAKYKRNPKIKSVIP